MTKKKPAEPELVICPGRMVTYDGCHLCKHAKPHRREQICYNGQSCEVGKCRCVPYKPEARTISESTTGKQNTKSTGQPSRGFSYGLSSCPMHREVALGAGTRLRLLRIHRDSTTGTEVFITTLPKQGVIHCVCRATVPNSRERCCVLDVRGKVIMCLNQPAMSAGPADPKPNGSTSSTEKSSGNGTKTDTTKNCTGSSTRGKKSETGSGLRSEKKRIVPIVAKPGGKESGTHNAMRTP